MVHFDVSLEVALLKSILMNLEPKLSHLISDLFRVPLIVLWESLIGVKSVRD